MISVGRRVLAIASIAAWATCEVQAAPPPASAPMPNASDLGAKYLKARERIVAALAEDRQLEGSTLAARQALGDALVVDRARRGDDPDEIRTLMPEFKSWLAYSIGPAHLKTAADGAGAFHAFKVDRVQRDATSRIESRLAQIPGGVSSEVRAAIVEQATMYQAYLLSTNGRWDRIGDRVSNDYLEPLATALTVRAAEGEIVTEGELRKVEKQFLDPVFHTAILVSFKSVPPGATVTITQSRDSGSTDDFKKKFYPSKYRVTFTKPAFLTQSLDLVVRSDAPGGKQDCEATLVAAPP